MVTLQDRHKLNGFPNHFTLRYPCALAISALAMIVGVGGCASKKHAAWTRKPEVRWENLSHQPLPQVKNGYRILVRQPTTGLFPASMAVSRVALEPSDEEFRATRPRLLADPRNEFLQWNRAFDDLMALSEVFPIEERTLGGGEAEPEQILAAYRALDARLGFVYAVNELSKNETEMIAVLYETKTSRPLACMHAYSGSAKPHKDLANCNKSEKGDKTDLWDTDSRALVRAKLEKYAHACLRELILGDQPAALEDTGGWGRQIPPRPAEWPPRDYQPPAELRRE